RAAVRGGLGVLGGQLDGELEHRRLAVAVAVRAGRLLPGARRGRPALPGRTARIPGRPGLDGAGVPDPRRLPDGAVDDLAAGVGRGPRLGLVAGPVPRPRDLRDRPAGL